MYLNRFIVFFALSLLFYNSFAQNKPKDSSSSRQLLIFPVVSRSIETDWSFGIATSATFHVSKRDTISRTSNMQGLILYSLKQQFVAALNGTQYLKKEQYILNDQISYSSFPDQFWGIGKFAPDTAQEAYTFKQYYLYLHLMRNVGHHFYLGLLYEMQNLMNVKYDHDGIFQKQTVPGKDPYFISGLGMSVTYDDRKEAFWPSDGTFGQVYFNHFGKLTGSDFDYTNFVVDIRKFNTMFKRQVLALQLYYYGTTGTVPIRSLASFGGNNSMRGYYDGRFRDKNQMVFQGEYRIPFNNRWGIALFGGGGDVSATLKDFELSQFKYSYGGGIRYALNKSEKLNLRLDYGIGQGSNSGFYFQLGEAF